MLTPCSLAEKMREHESKRVLLVRDSALAVMQHVIGDAGRVHGTFLHAHAHAGISLEQPTHKRPPLPMKHPAKAAEGNAR